VTVVHLVRHGEVHNPDGVLYGRIPGYRLSERGRAMAQRIAEHFSDGGHDVTHVVASPLQRAQETATPLAEALGLELGSDERLIEAANHFEGLTFGVGDGSLRHPRHWKYLWNPFRPSWGEPYRAQAARVRAAVVARARRAAGEREGSSDEDRREGGEADRARARHGATVPPEPGRALRIRRLRGRGGGVRDHRHAPGTAEAPGRRSAAGSAYSIPTSRSPSNVSDVTDASEHWRRRGSCQRRRCSADSRVTQTGSWWLTRTASCPRAASRAVSTAARTRAA
jgi:hypothetical protein